MKSNTTPTLVFNVVLGIIFLVAALLFNQVTWLELFDVDGELSVLRKGLLFFADILFIAVGIVLLIFRHKITFGVKQIFLVLGLLVLCSVVTEIGIRFYFSDIASKPAFARQLYLNYATAGMVKSQFKNHEFQYSPHPYLGYYPSPGYKNRNNIHNSLGFRGEEIVLPKPTSEYRIVCIGGSTTYTNGVGDYKKTYPYLMGQKLRDMGYTNVNVVNAGVGNADTWYSLINLEFRVLDLDPDMVIIYHGDNDIESRMVYPFSAYRGDNTGRVATLLESVPEEGILRKSVLIRILFYALHIPITNYGALHQLYPARTYVYGEVINHIRSDTYQGIFLNMDEMDLLKNNPPIYTERNVNNMIAVSKANGVKIILSSFGFAPLTKETSSRLYRKAIEETNQIMQDLAVGNQIPFFDFEGTMPKEKEYWIKDGMHVNEKGVKIKADLFADFVKKHIDK